MPPLLEGIIQAFKLIITLDPDLMRIVLLSLQVSGAAIIISTLLGVPLGSFLGLKEERKTRLISKIIFTLMGLPPVVAGLLIYLLLSRQGPLGVLGLLYTPTAMIIAQVCLALPIVTGLTMVAVRSTGREVEETARTLGAGRGLAAWTVIRESRISILGAIITGFGRVVAEVGAVMMVGGNIEGHTRVMTTAIVLETGKGNFEFAIGLGLILLLLAFLINSLLYRFQRGGGERHE
ncbi:MAG: ABC transporter permease [Dethiobacteria bacterium]|jgi:tungstate transport system permease protein|nr:ABC transporter permease [Bacillota bacterium]HOP68633.1 ABC transporter permease [Bacillota bacterium]